MNFLAGIPLHRLSYSEYYDYLKQRALKENYVTASIYSTEVGDLTKLIRDEGRENTTLVDEINYINERLNELGIEFKQEKYNQYIEEKKKSILSSLSEKDYYATDTHWKQENLDKVVETMNKTMNFNYQFITYKENTYNNFYGVYYGESAIKRDPEKIIYLTNNNLNNLKVNYLENKTLNKAFESDKFNEEYLDNYVKINYVDHKDIIENINTLLKVGYSNSDINIIFSHGDNDSVKKIC